MNWYAEQQKPDPEYASQQNQIQNVNKTKTETRSNKNWNENNKEQNKKQNQTNGKIEKSDLGTLSSDTKWRGTHLED